jgi:hypothetical protein
LTKSISDQTISIAIEFVNIELEEVIIKASKISAEVLGCIMAILHTASKLRAIWPSCY